MSVLVALAACLGAWLLVAGPIQQAAVELSDEEIDRDAMQHVVESVPRQRRVSPWLWLLPPVAFVRQRRASNEFREVVVRHLSAGQVEQWVHWNQKATGWALVGAGGLLLALRESWELVEALEWRAWAFWPIVVVAFLLCAANTVARMRGSHAAVQRARDRNPASAPEPPAQ